MILLSTPLFVTLGVLSLACFYFLATEYQSFEDYHLIIEKIFSLTDKNVLLAIPFFVVAGSLMCAGGIARRIIAFADALIGWLPGGLAAAAVLSCMFFAAISGSSPVTVIAIGSIMVPALIAHGYEEKFSVGLLTAAGSLGILIPPSIPMIIYAIMVGGAMSVSVGDLFIAGVVPGLLIGAIFIGYSFWHGMTRPDFSWSSLTPPSLELIGQRFAEGFWALLLPVLILGGIYPIFGDQGLFTPTEAAAVAVAYAFVVEIFIHRELEIRAIPRLLVESTVMMGALLVILSLSFALNHYLVDQQVADRMVDQIAHLELSRNSFLLLLNLFLLFVGCLMDIMSAIMVIAPLLAPMALAFGIDPVHLGIIFIVNLEIGYLTPPIGLNLFVSATLFKKPIGFVIRSVGVFIILMLCGLAAITWFEPTSVGLVRALKGQPVLGAPEAVTAPGSGEAPAPGEQAVPAPSGAETSTQSGVLTLEELMKRAKKGEAETSSTAEE
ncbi:MAG: TRAP transporter large permease subunit [Deltaproteobacteria bacterium]|nr:TRAP transporter large permease subunit [Deltaproteobacteria bacterium]